MHRRLLPLSQCSLTWYLLVGTSSQPYVRTKFFSLAVVVDPLRIPQHRITSTSTTLPTIHMSVPSSPSPSTPLCSEAWVDLGTLGLSSQAVTQIVPRWLIRSRST